MSRLLLLICKRLLILTLIFALSWFTIFKAFPFIDNRLPFGLAVVVTYGLLAYIGLPAMVRLWQALQKPTHVPTRTLAGDGWSLEPINLVVLARNERDLIWAMQKAGWTLAEPKTLRTSLKMIYATVFNKPYPNAPFNSTYVFGRKQDLGFQICIDNSPRRRHHVRFWNLGTTLLQDEHEHQGFWRRLLKRFIQDEKQVWVGAAIMDRGINLRMRDLQINHSVESDTTNERNFFVGTLSSAKVLKDSLVIKAGEPLHTRHQGFGERIIADGYIKLCEIKRQVLPPADDTTTD